MTRDAIFDVYRAFPVTERSDCLEEVAIMASPPSIASSAVPIYIAANALAGPALPFDTAMLVARNAGADGFEVRRELLPPIDCFDPARLRHLLAAFPAPPHYSAPIGLFEDGIVQRDALVQLVSEAQSLGCVLAKCGLGTLTALDHRALDGLRGALAACEQAAPDVLLAVENDQMPPSGRLDLWIQLFDAIHVGGHTTGMTFDVGNWTCVGVDVTAAARALGSEVRYVHIKRAQRAGSGWQSLPVRPADTLYPALTAIRMDVPRAIEYPLIGVDIDTDVKTDIDTITATAAAAVALVRSGHFTL